MRRYARDGEHRRLIESQAQAGGPSLIIIDRRLKLRVSLGVEERVHRPSRRCALAKTSSAGTPLTAPLVNSSARRSAVSAQAAFRRSRGPDIDAACGQLRRRNEILA